MNTSSSCTKSDSRIRVGYGYRLLEIGEIICPGDEFTKNGTNWESSCLRIGYTQNRFNTDPKDMGSDWPRRRKIDVGEGYELLPVGAQLKAGDQLYTRYTPSWSEFVFPKCLDKYSVVIDVDGNAVRRKIEIEKTPEQVYTERCSSVVVGEGYRLLKYGEKIEAGDECCGTVLGSCWIKVPRAGSTAGMFSDGTPCVWDAAYRRRVPTEREQRYIDSASKIKPGIGYRVLGLDDVVEDRDELLSTQFLGWKTSRWRQNHGALTVREILKKTSPGLQAFRRALPNAVDLLREEVARLHAVIDSEAKARDEAVKSRDEKIDALVKQIETQSKNANGNAVLVGKDGFSKPMQVSTAFVTVKVPTYSSGFDLSEIASGDGHRTFLRTDKRDGFGRLVYEEVP